MDISLFEPWIGTAVAYVAGKSKGYKVDVWSEVRTLEEYAYEPRYPLPDGAGIAGDDGAAGVGACPP